ncbi:MAG: VWA domain-containing protein [Planctomycetota bacterium]
MPALWSLVFLAVLSTPIDEREALAGFEKALSSLTSDKPDPETAGKALAELKQFDTPGAAAAIVAAYSMLESRIESLEMERRAAVAEQGYERLAEIRAQLDPIRQFQTRLLNSVSNFRERDTLEYLLKNVAAKSEAPLTLKLVASRATARLGDDLLPVYLKSLSRAKGAEEITVLLEGIAKMGSKAQTAGKSLVRLLSHADPTVRERAAYTFAEIGSPAGIEPMINRLDREEGRLQRKIAQSLERLTRQQLGASASAWRSWFKDNELQVTSGMLPLGGGATTVGKDLGFGYYNSIPQEGRALVYVIDVSGSMVLSWTNPQFDGIFPLPAESGEDSRLDICKRELNKALGALAEGTKFNIVAYGEGNLLFSDKLVEAKPSTIKKAQKWIENLDPIGSTNIHDALEKAFEFAGHGAVDRYYKPSVETIFLMTDGAPTLPDGSEDSTDRIMESVRRWNPYKSVVIHTVGLGQHLKLEFLRDLAQENNGIFVHREGGDKEAGK